MIGASSSVARLYDFTLSPLRRRSLGCLAANGRQVRFGSRRRASKDPPLRFASPTLVRESGRRWVGVLFARRIWLEQRKMAAGRFSES